MGNTKSTESNYTSKKKLTISKVVEIDIEPADVLLIDIAVDKINLYLSYIKKVEFKA